VARASAGGAPQLTQISPAEPRLKYPPPIIEEDPMRSSREQFLLTYGSEIREALIMIEGDDGGFELLAHGWLAGNQEDDGTLFTLVRSRNTRCMHLLVRNADRGPRQTYQWHRLRPKAKRALRDRLISPQRHAVEL
jgi:hypothetical protein